MPYSTISYHIFSTNKWKKWHSMLWWFLSDLLRMQFSKNYFHSSVYNCLIEFQLQTEICSFNSLFILSKCVVLYCYKLTIIMYNSLRYTYICDMYISYIILSASIKNIVIKLLMTASLFIHFIYAINTMPVYVYAYAYAYIHDDNIVHTIVHRKPDNG